MDDTNGNNSFIIACVLKNQRMESDTVNLVKSVYPLDDFATRITKASENGKLVVINKNKAEQMLATIGIQPAEVSRIINLANDSISDSVENVKENNTNCVFEKGQNSLGSPMQQLRYNPEAYAKWTVKPALTFDAQERIREIRSQAIRLNDTQKGR